MAQFDSRSMPGLPERLRIDGIIEAIFEARFKTTDVPEVTVGNLAAGISSSLGRGAQFERLPIADLPGPMRRGDPNLAHQPILQAWLANRARAVKIGEQVLSWHALKPYPGWNTFRSELMRAVEALARSVPNIEITRLGFRYVNALGSEHGVHSVQDLNLTVCVDGRALAPPLNINYRQTIGDQQMVTRIATPEFVQGGPGGFTVLIDIDLGSEAATRPLVVNDAMNWADRAHDALKAEFFRLLKLETLENLRED
jgi:uncharacterized protein (TIGR04255 family)